MSTARRSVRRLPLRLTPVGIFSLTVSLIGCLAIYNATYHRPYPYLFVGRQLVWLIIGSGALAVTTSLSSRTLRRLTPLLLLIFYAALWLVLYAGIQINGMRGWFSYRGIFMQPSELGKPVFLLGAAWLVSHRADRRSWWASYLVLFIFAILWVLPILLEPDIGGALVYALTFVGLCWCMGFRGTHLALSSLPCIPAVIVLFQWKPYLLERIQGFMHPELHPQTTGWHILQFQKALAAGGITGRSWGQGTWSQHFLPLPYSDSIFASLGEVIGFVGLLPFVLVVLAWLVYGWYRASRADTTFARALIVGVSLMLSTQAFLHLSVNLGLFPVTGLTLPLISYGGSSLVSTLTMIGLLEGAALYDPEPSRPDTPDPEDEWIQDAPNSEL